MLVHRMKKLFQTLENGCISQNYEIKFDVTSLTFSIKKSTRVHRLIMVIKFNNNIIKLFYIHAVK